MNIEHRQLRHLLAIVRCGSFSLAARELHISQPALSASIAQLEANIGGKLLDRGRNGAVATPLGAAMVRHAEIIDMQMRRAIDEAVHSRAHAQGPLNLAVTPVAAAHVLPRAIAAVKAELPDAAIHIRETVFSDAMQGLLQGAFDISLGPIGVYPSWKGVLEERLSSDTFCLIARAGNDIFHTRSQSLRSLTDAQWVLPSDQSAYRHQLEALFIVGGVPWPARAVLTDSMVVIKTIVMHSDCIAIMPQQLVQLELKAGVLQHNGLKEAGTVRALGLAYAADRPLAPLAQRFIDILRQQARAPMGAKPPKRR